jgi:DNA-binding transcriptional ArsR family regulator
VDPFPALADPVRRALLRRLASGPARVLDLAAEHPISRPAISRHLRVLGEAGLVRVTDVGRERHYELETSGLAPVHALLAELGPRVGFDPQLLDGLDLEVRRTVRERGATPVAPAEEVEGTA